MPSNPRVSVIIPCYSHPYLLPRCLHALEHQEGAPPYEVIVVDNGVDLWNESLHTGFPHVTVIIATTPGSYAARNAGLKIARGEIIAFTDDDCIPAPWWIHAGVQALEQAGRRALVAGRVALRYREACEKTPAELYQCAGGFDQQQLLASTGGVSTVNLWTWRWPFTPCGPFNASLYSSGDLEWTRRVAAAGCRVVYAPTVLVEHDARPTLSRLIARTRRVAGGWQRLGYRHGTPWRRAWDRAHHAHIHRGKDRWVVFGVALLLQAVEWGERVRLRLGGTPRRE